MVINTTIPSPPPRAVASYGFTDIATSRAMTKMYAGDTTDSKLLTQFTYYPYTGITNGGGAAIDIDFDWSIEQTTILDGPCVINVPFMFWNPTGGNIGPTEVTTAVTLYHYDGSTETSLGTASKLITTPNVGAGSGHQVLFAFDFNVTRQVFKSGDTVRLTVTSTDPGTGPISYIGHNPTGDVSGPPAEWATSGALTVQLPIVIDL